MNWSLLNMLADYFLIIRNYVLSAFRKESTRFTTKARFSIFSERILATIIGSNLSMVIPLFANQDLTPMLY